MLNFPISDSAIQRALRFVDRNPHLADSLPVEFIHNPQQLVKLLSPVFSATQRCRLGEYYIQANTNDQFHFLSTNLAKRSRINTTATGQCWLLGRTAASTFSFPLASVSRLHAVLGVCRDRGFYLLDLGSRNGTYLNQRRIPPLRKYFLRDGDTIHLSHLQFKFLIASCNSELSLYEMTQPLSAA
ncbi:FHA domain-containing protein [filamentous cyanobacterium LEGE 11480]|uniref:FHA domain-containing protein n=1 Tax=Romeriopsis navalis LEGE 11480 TaxID=2777977 RepID=A0A928VT28_9CYAN|nr:FHA domain-containing protein [Romeriopsis navalis]MBE9032035.1 FHA domain-containing protein [Romeriopsis navalis LEGE 11480]